MKGRGKKLEHQLARALWEEARGAGIEAQVAVELDKLAAALRGEPKLRQMLLHPAVSIGKKAALVQGALDLSGPMVSLSKALVAFRSPGLLAGVRRAYQGFLAAGAREVVVRVASAAPLPRAERELLAETMAAALRRPVRVEITTRKDLLGGIIVRVGERIVDGTLKGEFDRLEREMVASSAAKTSSGGRKTAVIKGRK